VKNKKKSIAIACLFLAILFLSHPQAFAGWETGAKAGFDSNVNRSLNDEKSDTFFSGYLSFSREATGESRLDWNLAASLEGTLFSSLADLNYGMVSLAPGVTFFFHPGWSISLSPLAQAKAVKDSDQSAVAFGGKLGLKQQIRNNLYTGQYYIYKDSRANVDTYSFTENIFGLFLGVNWTRAFFTELGYEFSRGDSYRTISTTSTAVSGRGKYRRYSTTFSSDVIREDVDQHSFGLSAGIDWTKSLFSHLSYTYTTTKGDIGTSTSHAAFVGIGHRFR
jgi:hypothetical protein